MDLVVHDPFWREFNTLGHRLDRILDGFGQSKSNINQENLDRWSPVVDICEQGEDVALHAELPGVKKEDIDICVENNVLTVCGKREPSIEAKENCYVLSERNYGNFRRSFSLPNSIDSNKISANYKDGVLSLILPKAEEAKPKQIDVKVS